MIGPTGWRTKDSFSFFLSFESFHLKFPLSPFPKSFLSFPPSCRLPVSSVSAFSPPLLHQHDNMKINKMGRGKNHEWRKNSWHHSQVEEHPAHIAAILINKRSGKCTETPTTPPGKGVTRLFSGLQLHTFVLRVLCIQSTQSSSVYLHLNFFPTDVFTFQIL